MDLIRQGKISSIDKKKGMARVVYSDRDNEVTALFPILQVSGENCNLKVGDMVLVVHLSSGTQDGVILGTFWNGDNPPHKDIKSHRELGSEEGEAFIDYKDGLLTLHADRIKLDSEKMKITGSTKSKKTIRAKNFATNTAKFNTHIHTGVNGDTSAPH